jgi:hypothetical protein
MNEANDKGPTDGNKHWWPQAALVGLECRNCPRTTDTSKQRFEPGGLFKQN